MNTFITTFNSYSNISEIKEFDYNESNAYTYSLHYLDSKLKTPFYLQIVWFEHNDSYYILDIEFPLEDLNNYTNLINEILEALTIKN